MKFISRYNRRVDRVNSLLCVGLDSNADSLPERFRKDKYPQFAFNRWVVEETQEFVSAYKLNFAFYESRGVEGIMALRQTVVFLQEEYPDIVTIADAKRADIGSSNRAYARAIFDTLGFDAVTLHPYFGKEALQPFLERQEKGCIVLCRTSNPGAGELQNLVIKGKPLWQVVAENVRDGWNIQGNCLLVVGATYPEELAQVRQIVSEMTLLVPGVGTQGGKVKKIVPAGINSTGKGIIVNSSREIIFSQDPHREALKLRDKINKHRN